MFNPMTKDIKIIASVLSEYGNFPTSEQIIQAYKDRKGDIVDTVLFLKYQDATMCLPSIPPNFDLSDEEIPDLVQ